MPASRDTGVTRRLRMPTWNSGPWATEHGEYSRMFVRNVVKSCRAARHELQADPHSGDCLLESSQGVLQLENHSLAGSAFHTLMSSNKPSFPATPISILDLLACPIPDDLR
jgi:hypothetical protein